MAWHIEKFSVHTHTSHNHQAMSPDVFKNMMKYFPLFCCCEPAVRKEKRKKIKKIRMAWKKSSSSRDVTRRVKKMKEMKYTRKSVNVDEKKVRAIHMYITHTRTRAHIYLCIVFCIHTKLFT